MARRTTGAANKKVGGSRDAGLGQMTPIAELARDTVVCRVAASEASHEVHVQRFRSGQVGMTCDCTESLQQGWCQHRVDLLCKRYDTILDSDPEMRLALDRILGGTLLEEDALRLDGLVSAFNESLAAFDAGRPNNILGDNLATFTELVSDLAAVSADLEDAIGRLRRRFEVGSGLIKRSGTRITEPA